MSEYQYYEFVAVDGPISDEGLHYAESCSSRADVSRLYWRNVYHFGSFKGSVERLLQYYDAHFYIANWGSVHFALSFPKGTLHWKTITPYDQVAKQLEELRAAYQQAGEDKAFQGRLETFRAHYARRTAMMRRIKDL